LPGLSPTCTLTTSNSPFAFNNSGAHFLAFSKILLVVSESGVVFQLPACFVPPKIVVPDCGLGKTYVILGSEEVGFDSMVVIRFASPFTVTVWPRIGYTAWSGTRVRAPRPVAMTNASILGCGGEQTFVELG